MRYVGRSSLFAIALCIVAAPSVAQPLPDAQRGEEGESCRSKRDCKDGLVCLRDVCSVPGIGESCEARADCAPGLACIDNTCVERGTAAPPVAPVPTPVPAPPPPVVPPPAAPPVAPSTAPSTAPPVAPSTGRQTVAPPAVAPPPAPFEEPPPPLPPAERDWWDFEIGNGTVPYAGIALGPGFAFTYDYNAGQAGSIFGSFLFAIRAGFLFGHTDLQVEVSPVTWLPATAGQPVLQANISLGTLHHIAGNFYWPTRFGLGVAAVNLPDPLFMQRLELIGLAYQMGHVLIELDAPTFRHGTDFSNYGLFSFGFNLGASYAFAEL